MTNADLLLNNVAAAAMLQAALSCIAPNDQASALKEMRAQLGIAEKTIMDGGPKLGFLLQGVNEAQMIVDAHEDAILPRMTNLE